MLQPLDRGDIVVYLTLDLLSKRVIDSLQHMLGWDAWMTQRAPVKMIWGGGCTHIYIGNDRDLCEGSTEE